MSGPTLRGMRVLVVEDNFVVADALRFLLEGYEATVPAMAPSLARGFEALGSVPVDVAVLDINLGDSSVVPLAEHLRDRGVPFVFLSGYGDLDLLPEHLRDRPRLDKPVDAERLLLVLRSVVTARRDPAAPPDDG